MRKIFSAVALAFAMAAPAPAATPPPPVIPHVIFDTDMGNDVDDALALAMLHAFAARGELKLLAVTVTKDNPWAVEYIHLVDEYYGQATIPVGIVHDGKTREDGLYIRQVCELHGRRPSSGAPPDAVQLLRKTLAAEEDGAVAVIQVGFSTNLARLLESPPDAYSGLDGTALVKKKVRSLTVMAGNFASAEPEYNVLTDVPSAAKLFATWPTAIYFSGFELGKAVLYPATSIENDFAPGNPVAEAYRVYAKMPYDRPSWDLTTVLYLLRPNGGYFGVSPPGDVAVAADGSTKFQPGAQGKRYFLQASAVQIAKIREACVWLASQPASGAQKKRSN